MEFRVIVSPRAQKEIETAIDFYLDRSEDAPKNFILALERAYESLSINPFYTIRYKNVRSLKLSKFPFSLFFMVDKDKHLVQVLSCFHNKRSPTKRPY